MEDNAMVGSAFAGDLNRSGVVATAGVGAAPVVRWRQRLDADLVGAPVRASGQLIVCDASNRVHAFDETTGQVRWSCDLTGGIAASVAVAGDRVYVGGPRSAVTAVDLADGAVCWQSDHRGDWQEVEHPSVVSSPTVVGDVLVYRTSWGMHGLDRHSGAALWWTDMFTEADLWDCGALPAVREGLVLATRLATDNGNAVEGSLVAVAVADGEQMWEYTDDEDNEGNPAWFVCPSHPVVAGDRVYVAEASQTFDDDTDEGFLTAVDVATGERVWRSDALGNLSRLWHAPAVADGLLWLPLRDPVHGRDAQPAPAGGSVVVLDAGTGAQQAQIGLSAAPVTGPLVAGEYLYLLTADDAVRAIHRATGSVRWRVALADETSTDRPTRSAGMCLADGWIAVQYTGHLLMLASE
jgi:outer membrane protein assembly factor BamB